MNAKKLLQAKLPAAARAAGMRSLHASPVPDRQNRIDVLMDYFPDVEQESLRKAISMVMGVAGGEVDTFLTDYGDELIFHIATNPEFRSALLNAATRRRASRARLQRAIGANKVLQSSASAALKGRLSGR